MFASCFPFFVVVVIVVVVIDVVVVVVAFGMRCFFLFSPSLRRAFPARLFFVGRASWLPGPKGYSLPSQSGRVLF